MKKILHFKLPLDKNGTFLISAQDIGNFSRHLKKILPKYYLTIFTPFEIDIKGDKVRFDITKFEGKIPKEQLDNIKNIIEKEGYVVEIIK